MTSPHPTVPSSTVPLSTVLLSGSSGLIGRALVPHLLSRRWNVQRLVRRAAALSKDEIAWDPFVRIQFPTLTGINAVIHLAGESIADGRWTKAKKQRIRDSRVIGTTTLCEGLLSLTPRPKVLISASAVGFYGSRGDESLDEISSPGSGYLSEVSQEWERATEIARTAGIRVVNLRLGIVLSPEGGALKKMRLPFSLGLGGRLGSGKQWMSWIAIEDVIALIERCLVDESLHGAINAVSPSPVTNAEFTAALGKVCRRPTFCSIPEGLLSLIAGEFAREALLASTRVYPRKALDAGFQFQFPELSLALTHYLAR